MAGYAGQATPPSSADRKAMINPLFQHPVRMSPSPWAVAPPLWTTAAPPTPQDSQASICHSTPASPTPQVTREAQAKGTTEEMVETEEKEVAEEEEGEEEEMEKDDDDDGVLVHSDGNAARTASLRRSQPTLIVIGPKAGNAAGRATAGGAPAGLTGREQQRMQQWLSEIPAPVTPQERYLQGLNPAVDHPLHPRPLRAVAPRQARYLGSAEASAEDNDTLLHEYEKLAIDGTDKENAMTGLGLSLDHKVAAAQATKKRHMPEDAAENLARKRTRLLDPVRRFSQRLSSSLALSSASDDGSSRRRDSQELSPEDAAKQNEQLYRFGRLGSKAATATATATATASAAHGSQRLSLPKRYYGTLRSQGSQTMRRLMAAPKLTVAAMAPPPPPRGSTIGYWTEGRPDMTVNVAFIGDARVGKSALIKRLVHGTFPQTYAPSDIQEHTVRLTVDDTRVQLNLAEGGSGRDPREPSILALNWFSVVVLCFDIGRQSTLESLQKYRNDIARYEESSVVVLAGLKKDVRRRLPPLQLSFVEDPVQVGTESAQQAARAMRCDAYFECSSLSACEGIDDLFDYVMQSGVDFQRARDRRMARFRFERSVDKGMERLADGVRSLFTFHASGNA